MFYNFSKKGLLSVILSSIAAMSFNVSDSSARILYYEGFESGSIDSKAKVSCPSRGDDIRIQSSTVRSGSRAALIKKEPNRNKRCEVLPRKVGDFQWGKEYWTGFSFNVPYIPRSGWGIIQQHHAVPGYSGGRLDWSCVAGGNGFTIKVKPEGFLFMMQGPNSVNQVPRSKSAGSGQLVYYRVPVKTNRWYDVVTNFRYSDSSNGFYKIWLNGKLVVDIKGPNVQRYDTCGREKGRWYYMIYGVYPGNQGHGAVYYDEIRIGDASSSYAEVAPKGSARSPNSYGGSRPTSSEGGGSSSQKAKASPGYIDKSGTYDKSKFKNMSDEKKAYEGPRYKATKSDNPFKDYKSAKDYGGKKKKGTQYIVNTSSKWARTKPKSFESPTKSDGKFVDVGSSSGFVHKDWFNSASGNQYNGKLTVEFEATPAKDDTVAIVGVSQNEVPIHKYVATSIAFMKGHVYARNDDGYRSEGAHPFKGGEKFKVRMEIDIPSKTYDVYISRGGGAESVLAAGYSFRETQKYVRSLGNIAARSSKGGIEVSNVKFRGKPMSEEEKKNLGKEFFDKDAGGKYIQGGYKDKYKDKYKNKEKNKYSKYKEDKYKDKKYKDKKYKDKHIHDTSYKDKYKDKWK